MKNLFLLLTLVAFGLTASAQTSTTETSDLKDHQCTTKCNSEGHFYAHGEKDHTCGDDCMKMMKAKTDKETLIAHVCTSKCSSSGHSYAHGEKGHVCGDACKDMMKKDE